MALSADDVERTRSLLASTVGVLCRNSLRYNTELRIQGLIGITLDSEQVFLVSINELFATRVTASKEQEAKVLNCEATERSARNVSSEILNKGSHAATELQAIDMLSDGSQSAGTLGFTQHQSCAEKGEPPHTMEVASVYSLAQQERCHRSAEKVHNEKTPFNATASCQASAGMHAHHLKCADSERRDRKCRVLPEFVALGEDGLQSTGLSESCIQKSDTSEPKDSDVSKLLLCHGSGESYPADESVESSNVNSDGLADCDDIIFVKQEVQSPPLTDVSGPNSGLMNSLVDSDGLSGKSEHAFGLTSDALGAFDSHFQLHSQYSSLLTGNNVCPAYFSSYVSDHLSSRTGARSRAVHQCDYAGCGLRFCHRRHLLRHQTIKHGRPKGRGGRRPTLQISVSVPVLADQTTKTDSSHDDGQKLEDVATWD